MTPGTVLLEAQHVTQRFRLPNGQNLEALRDVSLAVRENEVVALVGPSGCGKSTLLRLFAGLAHPVDGKVLYRGQSLDGVLRRAESVAQRVERVVPRLGTAGAALGRLARRVTRCLRWRIVRLHRGSPRARRRRDGPRSAATPPARRAA